MELAEQGERQEQQPARAKASVLWESLMHAGKVSPSLGDRHCGQRGSRVGYFEDVLGRLNCALPSDQLPRKGKTSDGRQASKERRLPLAEGPDGTGLDFTCQPSHGEDLYFHLDIR